MKTKKTEYKASAKAIREKTYKPKTEPTILKCTNKECNYEWEYKGKSPFYATCPRCYRKINIKKQLKK